MSFFICLKTLVADSRLRKIKPICKFVMGGVLSSSIVEEEVNGNDLPNTPLEEKLLALTKKNKELQQKVASAEGQFEELLEKNDEMTKKNLELLQKAAAAESQFEELFKKNREMTKTNHVSIFFS